MARGDHQDDDDDFMELPQQNRATGRTKHGDEKKTRHRNRASQERLTILTEGFTNEQKGAAREMGMQALMDVQCKNLVNPICDWLGEIYDPASREFVIPGRGRLPLDEELVFCTLGVPRGEIKVPYEVNNKIEEALFARLFPGMASMPNTTVLATSLEGMKTHGEVFKMKLLMYLISAVFAPTTSLRPSNKCFPILAKLKDVKNMNWCKFIADFLHDAFSNKMYQKGCRLHLMLMYVDRLDLSTVDFTGIGGPPPPHKFIVSAWTYDAVKVVLAADRITDTKYGKLQLMAKHAIDCSVFGGPQNFGKWRDVHSAPSCPAEARAPVERLVGQFASGMTSLLGKLVEGWTALNGSDSDAVARQFTPFVGERTHRPTGCRGRYDYNNSQELPDMQDEVDGDAGLDKHDDDDMENVQHETADNEHVEVRVGGMALMMAQPMADGRKAVKFAELIVQATPEEISPSLDEAYRRIEEEALKRRSSRGQGQSSSNVPAESVSEDTVRSATPGSVRQHRVVHASPMDDYEPEVKATKEQNHLYDIVKRFGNVRSNSKYMKELKA
ncbi:hypothetical protein VPH35_099412 [Triticum aestivum]